MSGSGALVGANASENALRVRGDKVLSAQMNQESMRKILLHPIPAKDANILGIQGFLKIEATCAKFTKSSHELHESSCPFV
jgi:hypothetical protein